MIERLLRTVSLVACAFVCVGFLLFAVDQAGNASKRQQDKIADVRKVDPTPEEEGARERQHSAARELVDDVNDALLKPFAGVVDSDDPWVHRGIPTLLALALYGFGLGYLASFARGRL